MSDEGLPSPDAIESDDLGECAFCAGLFLFDDMDGEHCCACSVELFGHD